MLRHTQGVLRDVAERPAVGGGGGRPPTKTARGWGGGDSNNDGGYRAGERLRLAVWVGIAGIVMFFAAISSAMVVRRIGDDWLALDLPAVLYLSTAILLFSSVALEIARRQLRNGTLDKLRTWTFATLVLGLAFLVAQTLGWRDLLAQGVSMSNSASGSFFYILTAAHALHVLGGIGALIYLAARARMARPWANRLAAVDATAIYWHFLGVLWVYLFILLGVLA
ncbi:MAG: cytochrome c oxidase subunit 3 [Bryobacterales bacterium]